VVHTSDAGLEQAKEAVDGLGVDIAVYVDLRSVANPLVP